MEPSHHPPIVLIVEDELFIRMMATDIFLDIGFVVYEAACADDALHFLAAHPGINLLFTDIDMPGTMNGLALAALAHEKWPNTALIVTSGGQWLGNEIIPDGGVFLPKPYRSDELERVVRAKLGALDNRICSPPCGGNTGGVTRAA